MAIRTVCILQTMDSPADQQFSGMPQVPVAWEIGSLTSVKMTGYSYAMKVLPMFKLTIDDLTWNVFS